VLSQCILRKANRLVATALFSVLMAGCSSDSHAPMRTVSNFEVERYLGQWHQVAAIPAWFQSDCLANTAADYTMGEDGLIEVVNSCETADGLRKKAEARARFLKDPSDGRLEVTFVEVAGLWVWPAAGDYWIIGLDPDYRWAVVGQPSREFAWILARSRTLDAQTLRDIQHILEREAYDTCELLLTAPDQQGRICDVTR
jgi:apolipoprotein D and lipocalin family protein